MQIAYAGRALTQGGRACPAAKSSRPSLPCLHPESSDHAAARLHFALCWFATENHRNRDMLEELKNKLAEEIERLTHELQVVLPQAIKKAVEHGDLRENSEYKSALERQQFVQARLNHLTQRAGELSKIDLSQVPVDSVGFGSRVTVVDMRTREEETYTLVFGDFIDKDNLDSGQISMASLLGQQLLGKKKGEKVSVQLPRGERKLHIKEVVTLSQMVQKA
jgi:transcription elongation factor GreA